MVTLRKFQLITSYERTKKPSWIVYLKQNIIFKLHTLNRQKICPVRRAHCSAAAYEK